MCLVVKRQMRRMCWLLRVAKRMFLANGGMTRTRYLLAPLQGVDRVSVEVLVLVTWFSSWA